MWYWLWVYPLNISVHLVLLCFRPSFCSYEHQILMLPQRVPFNNFYLIRKNTWNNMSSALWAKLNEIISDAKPPRPGGLRDMLYRNWYLGLTSFGGPAVHFQIVCSPFISAVLVAHFRGFWLRVKKKKFRALFVEKLAWIDDQMVWTR